MNIQADTIAFDTAKIAKYQADPAFDYNSQLNLPEPSIFDIISGWFNRLINSIFGGKFGSNVTTPLMITIFIIIIAASLYFLYLKRPELFMRNRRLGGLDYETLEENIHSIDFEREIEQAIEKGDYRLAVRLKYLQTLRYLSDNNLINWQIHKTPTEYYYELGRASMKPAFRELTNSFLEVRYGNYPASEALFDRMRELLDEIKKML
ncbi:MAG: DUF4129 domain-containing protein [Dysgonamonadaceae bacterium]|jgi:hypothetical protein|nr:DUF4129 domain-containing protein [Dysgonamonadaceae bacterium]